MENQTQTVLMNRALMENIHTYLLTRPMNEVEGLVTALRTNFEVATAEVTEDPKSKKA